MMIWIALKDQEGGVDLTLSLLPLLFTSQMLEKTREAQAASLTDLQTELKSLKSLLVSRGSSIASRPTYGLNASNNNPSGSTSPSFNTEPASTSSANGNGNGNGNPPSSPNHQTSGIPVPTNPTSPLPFGTKPSIPAWQLASNSTPATTTNTESKGVESS